jgi:type II secretory pathway pseudopilin PulG
MKLQDKLMSAENTGGKADMARKNFTLVEILAVMALMAILLFIALPAFEKLVKGGGVDIAARNLSGKLGVARGYAINSRQYVAVLMPDANLPNDYLFRSYRLCVVSTTTPNVFNFSRWIPSENWGFLPTGAAINHINNNVHPAGSSSDWAKFPLVYTFASEGINGVKLPEIPGYALVPGNVRAIIFRPNGKIAGASGARYVAVSESTYSGTTLLSTNPNNWIDIKIDEYTGRVNYGIE